MCQRILLILQVGCQALMYAYAACGRPPLILMAFFQKMMLEFFRAIILDDALKRNGEKEGGGHRRLGTLRQKCCVYSLTFNCRNLFFWIRDKDDDVAASICIGTFIYNACIGKVNPWWRSTNFCAKKGNFNIFSEVHEAHQFNCGKYFKYLL